MNREQIEKMAKSAETPLESHCYDWPNQEVAELAHWGLVLEAQRDALAAHLVELNEAIITVFAANNTSRVAGFDRVLEIASKPIRGVSDE